MRRRLVHAALIAAALAVVFSPGSALADRVVEKSNLVADVVASVLPSVVNISTTKLVNKRAAPMGSFGNRPDPRLGKSLGSGVVVSKSGYVVTNNHVVDGAHDIMVGFSNGRELSAKIVGADPNSDLAILKLKGKNATKGLVPIKMGRSSKMRLGETVLAIGNPFGVGQTVTMGIVSAKGRANLKILDYEDFIQTDAAINPGNSGGALINLKGELIGINTAILSRTGGSQGIGFAIPTDIVQPIIKSLIKSGRVSRGYLGVTIQTLDDELARALGLKVARGVLVTGIKAGSPARKAGLKRNDVVVSLNGSSAKTDAQFRTKIASLGAGSRVILRVARGKKITRLALKLAELPGSRRTAKGRGNRTQFGISVTPVNDRSRRQYALPGEVRRGIVVTAVDDGSRAAEIGLQPGDVIYEVNRAAVGSGKQFQAAYRKSKSKLALLVYRDGSAVYIVINK